MLHLALRTEKKKSRNWFHPLLPQLATLWDNSLCVLQLHHSIPPKDKDSWDFCVHVEMCAYEWWGGSALVLICICDSHEFALLSFGSFYCCCLEMGFCLLVFCLPGATWLGEAAWAESFRNLPISYFPGLALKVWLPHPAFLFFIFLIVFYFRCMSALSACLYVHHTTT